MWLFLGLPQHFNEKDLLKTCKWATFFSSLFKKGKIGLCCRKHFLKTKLQKYTYILYTCIKNKLSMQSIFVRIYTTAISKL